MGYMGFGLQKWIYRMRPRHPFSKGKKAGYDTIPLDKFHFGIPPDRSGRKIPLWIFTIIVFLFSTVIILYLNDFVSDQEKLRVEKEQRIDREKQGEFNSFYLSGLSYYENGQWIRAKGDFEFALRLKENHHEASTYYIACLLKLGETNRQFRAQILSKLDSLSRYYPDDPEFNKLAIQYFLLTGDTTNAIKELDQVMQ